MGTLALASTSGREAAPKLRLVSHDHFEETDSQLIRAASYLRAHSFGIYPEDRSEYAKRAHLLISANDALEAANGRLAANARQHMQMYICIHVLIYIYIYIWQCLFWLLLQNLHQ